MTGDDSTEDSMTDLLARLQASIDRARRPAVDLDHLPEEAPVTKPSPTIENLSTREPDGPETDDERDARRCGFHPVHDGAAWKRLPQHVQRKMLRLADERDTALAQAATALGETDAPMAVLDPHIRATALPDRGDQVHVRFLLDGGTAESRPPHIDVVLRTDGNGRRTLDATGHGGTGADFVVAPRSSNRVELAFTPSRLTW